MWRKVTSWLWPLDPDLNSEEEDLQGELLMDENLPQEVKKEGTVTQLEADYGLIDGKFYYPRTLRPKISTRPIRTGDKVVFRATRKSEQQEWVVVELLSLDLGDEWDCNDVHQGLDDHDSSFDRQKSRESGTVVRVRNDLVTVEVHTLSGQHDLEFSLRDFPLDFCPQKGDFLSLDVHLEGTDLDELKGALIRGVQPLRAQVLPDAYVTSWWANTRKGIVEGHIFFSTDACTRSYRPRANDNVRVHAVECEGTDRTRKCTWRATRVVPKGMNFIRQQHLSTAHLQNPEKSSLLQQLLSNKCGVEIQDVVDLGPVMVGQSVKVDVWVRNCGTQRRELMEVQFKSKCLKLEHDSSSSSIVEPGSQVKVTVVATGLENHLGHDKVLALFKFKDFQIGAQVVLEICHPSMTQYSSNSNYCGRQQPMMYRSNNDASYVIPGQKRRTNRVPTFVKRRLEEYAIPRHLVVDAIDREASELLDKYPHLGEELCFENYREKFASLLHLEEIEQQQQMLKYSLTSVPFKHQGQYLYLEVPGLAEKRPSLVLGDTAIASKSGIVGAQKFEGCIHEVKSQGVLLMFDQRFHSIYCGEVYDVEFKFGRGQFKRQHQAVQEVAKNFGPQVLFPMSVRALPAQVEFCQQEDNNKHVTVFKHNRFPVQHSNLFRDKKLTSLDDKNGPGEPSNSSLDKSDLEESKSDLGKSKSDVDKSSFSSKSDLDKSSSSKSDLEKSKNDLGKNGSSSSKCDLDKSSSSKSDLGKSSSSSSKSAKRKSVAERMFGPKPGMEWLTPKFPLVPSLTKQEENCTVKFQSKTPLEYEFQLERRRTNKKAVLPYVPKSNNKRVNQRGVALLQWANEGLNKEQKSAVERILGGHARPLPYIIYGPPGTGKTVTLVEAVIQVFHMRPDARILVATPSNSSADLIVERLHHSGRLGFGDLARLNAFQRNQDNIPGVVLQYSFPNDDLAILGKVARHRIVVATCSTTGGLYKLGLSEGHFTHCFVDEAGETTEPETMIPIGLLASSHKSQIILAGDPKQLGPVLQSNLAKLYGLEVSLLERLSKSGLYERNEAKFDGHGNYDPLLVTKLIRNYRSHPDILEVPSKLFYDDELLAMAPKKRTDFFLDPQKFPGILNNQQHPVVFHGVRGQNYQEGDSPSWFNPAEALQASHYVGRLIAKGVEPEDIGVIAPYRQQVAKMKQILQSLDLPLPKIGSVEEFQGQERPVIIVTTVRTSGHASFVEGDALRGLGFLQSEKRFNVAMTRAMSLLIVIGDPHLLAGDPSWNAFIQHCLHLEAYVGCDLPIGLSNGI